MRSTQTRADRRADAVVDTITARRLIDTVVDRRQATVHIHYDDQLLRDAAELLAWWRLDAFVSDVDDEDLDYAAELAAVALDAVDHRDRRRW